MRAIASVEDVWGSAELLLKVKEPIAEEYGRLREGLTLFTYLHIAADEPLTRALVDSGITAIAYETVETADRQLPLLAPMSEVAGRLAPQMGAWSLEKAHGGRGILLGGVPGVPPAKVVILGGGVVGLNAAIIALGMQADVWVLDKSVERMRDLEIALDGRVTLAMSNRLQIEEILADADMVIGAVLVPGALAPKLVTREMLGLMKPGAVLVDVAIDQGGCFETSHATTHDDPVFEVDGIVHYCVANMPGAVPVTSTKALTNVTLPYVEAIADKGVARAIADDPALAKGVNVVGGKITYEAVAAGARPRLRPLADALLRDERLTQPVRGVGRSQVRPSSRRPMTTPACHARRTRRRLGCTVRRDAARASALQFSARRCPSARRTRHGPVARRQRRRHRGPRCRGACSADAPSVGSGLLGLTLRRLRRRDLHHGVRDGGGEREDRDDVERQLEESENGSIACVDYRHAAGLRDRARCRRRG